MQEQIPIKTTQDHSYKIYKLSAQQAKSLNFISDPNSPYSWAPPEIKKMFVEEECQDNRSVIKWNGQMKLFSLLPSPGHICTRIFPSGSNYYTCRQCCCQTKPGVTMCYCQQCWQPERHVGHTVRKQQSYGSAYCDCGRQQRIKPESFCQPHSNKQKNKAQIPQELQKIFIPYYESLFLCLFYLKINKQSSNLDSTLQSLLQNEIQRLCENSLIYIRLVTKILQKKILIIHEKDNPYKQVIQIGLELVLNFMNFSEKMIFSMTADNQFKFLLAKTFKKMKAEGWKANGFSLITSQLYETNDILFRLAEQNQFILDKKQRYIAIANQSQQGLEMFKKFIEFNQKKLSQEQFLNFLLLLLPKKYEQSLFRNKTFSEKFLQIVLSIIIPDCKKERNYYLFTINQMSIDKKIIIFSWIAMIFFSLADGNILQVGPYWEKFSKIGEILGVFCKNIRALIMKSGENNQAWIVVYLTIIFSSPKKNQFLEAFWKGLVQDDNQIREDMVEIIAAIYHLTSIIINSQQFFNQMMPKAQNTKTESLLELQNANKQEWVKSFLYESNEIPKQRILKLKEQGFFNFPRASKVLRELCTFDYAKDAFCYTSQAKYPNYFLKFAAKRGSLDLRSIPNKNWRISDQLLNHQKQPQISEKGNRKQLVQMIFNNEFFAKYLWQKWVRKIRTKERTLIQNFWKNQNLGYYFALTFIYANVLSNGQNVLIQQCINNIKNVEEYLEIIYLSTTDQNKIDELLQINLNNCEAKRKIQQNKKSEQKHEPKSSENSPNPKKQLQPIIIHQHENEIQKTPKTIAQIKKQLLLQKLKKSAQKFIGDSKQEIQEKTGINNCIICKESNKENDQVMYLAYLNKNVSPTYSLYGNSDKSQVRLSGCLHFMHSSCFAGLAKSNFDFNCPLCARKCNILLPLDVSHKKTLRRCNNIINSIEVGKFKNNDYNGLLMTCLKHIVGVGLDWIVYASSLNNNKQKQKQKKNKFDKIILNIAKQIVSKFSQSQLSQFEDQFKSLIQEIEKAVKSQKSKCLATSQILIAGAFRSAIFDNKQLNTGLLEQISNTLNEQDRNSLFEILSDLLGQEVRVEQCPSQNKKIYLTFQCAQLPKSPKLFKKNKCNKCSTQNQKYFCLLCSKTFCQPCLQSLPHNEEHSSSILALEIECKRLVVKQNQGTINGVHHLYYDAFMCHYDEKSKNNWTDQEMDQYVVDKYRFDKIILGFLMRV